MLDIEIRYINGVRSAGFVAAGFSRLKPVKSENESHAADISWLIRLQLPENTGH